MKAKEIAALAAAMTPVATRSSVYGTTYKAFVIWTNVRLGAERPDQSGAFTAIATDRGPDLVWTPAYVQSREIISTWADYEITEAACRVERAQERAAQLQAEREAAAAHARILDLQARAAKQLGRPIGYVHPTRSYGRIELNTTDFQALLDLIPEVPR